VFSTEAQRRQLSSNAVKCKRGLLWCAGLFFYLNTSHQLVERDRQIRTRFPVALNTAFAIDAATPVIRSPDSARRMVRARQVCRCR